ncbi:MAG: hypothetical protein HC888_09890 [Candidatus Competibacteraceae bacterium]|nr:hypothetical protein [Candidatus Competibacteraceae bacterium]
MKIQNYVSAFGLRFLDLFLERYLCKHKMTINFANTLLAKLSSVIEACRLAEETANKVWFDEKRENDATRNKAVQASLAKREQDKEAPFNEYLTVSAEIKKRQDKLLEDYKAACARRQSLMIVWPKPKSD